MFENVDRLKDDRLQTTTTEAVEMPLDADSYSALLGVEGRYKVYYRYLSDL